MRTFIATVLMVTLSGLASAQAVDAKTKPLHKKPVKHKTHATRPAFVSTPMTPSPVADARQQDIVADLVHTGRMVCELGNVVTVTPDPQSSTGFLVQIRKQVFRMVPVVSATGAIRLEDAQAGAMWLQLSNKSMLMNSKVGQRMADECQSSAQMAVAEAMKLAPPPSLFDTSSVAKK